MMKTEKLRHVITTVALTTLFATVISTPSTVIGVEETTPAKTINHKSNIGEIGISFSPRTSDGEEVLNNEIWNDTKQVDHLIVNKTEKHESALDLEELAGCDLYTYKGFEYMYEYYNPDFFTNENCTDIMDIIIHLKELPEDDTKFIYDLYVDGQTDVRDAIFLRQIYTAYPLSYMKIENFSILMFNRTLLETFEHSESVKVIPTQEFIEYSFVINNNGVAGQLVNNNGSWTIQNMDENGELVETIVDEYSEESGLVSIAYIPLNENGEEVLEPVYQENIAESALIQENSINETFALDISTKGFSWGYAPKDSNGNQIGMTTSISEVVALLLSA